MSFCGFPNVFYPTSRKIIELNIIDEESYEKSLIMYVNIGEPRQIAGTLSTGLQRTNRYAYFALTTDYTRIIHQTVKSWNPMQSEQSTLPYNRFIDT